MKYPNLTHILYEVLSDQGPCTDPAVWQWPEDTVDLPALEHTASQLTKEEQEVLAAGEYTESWALACRSPELKTLWTFIEDVFDGPYTDLF